MLSSVTLSYSEFTKAGCIVSLNDSGEVVVNVSAHELQSLTQFLVTAPADFSLIGISLTLCLEDGSLYVLDSGRVCAVVVEEGEMPFVPLYPDESTLHADLFAVSAALMPKSLPGFVGLTFLADELQDQIASGSRELACLISNSVGIAGEPGFRAPTANSLVGLTAALNSLQQVIDCLASPAQCGTSGRSLMIVGPPCSYDMSELRAQLDALREMVVSALESDLRLVHRRMESIVERFDLVIFSDVRRFLSLIDDGEGHPAGADYRAPTTRSIVGLHAAIEALRGSGLCDTEALQTLLQEVKELLQPCINRSLHKRSSGFDARMTSCLHSLFQN